MIVNWVIGTSGKETGNFLGYATANERICQALNKFVEVRSGYGDVAVHFCHPCGYRHVGGVPNVLFTMFEVPDPHQIIADFVPAFKQCDLIVVPSKFCLELFRPYTDKPIEICPLGVNVEDFPYRRRRYNFMRDTFRWLVVAAPNPRKYSLLLELWAHVLWPLRRDGFPVELYYKTTGIDEKMIVNMLVLDGQPTNRFKDGIYSEDGFTLDNRKVPLDELRDIYYSGHGFLGLHMGEGWNLPILEAMATGLPALITDWSSTQEYATSKNSYLCKPIVAPVDCGLQWMPTEKIVAAIPDPDDVTRHLVSVMREYPRAMKIGKRAAETAKLFSWHNAGRRLAEILRHVTRHLTGKSQRASVMGTGESAA